MCKALGSIPSERKMPLSVRQSSCGASEEESREAEPNLTVACSLPIITVGLSRPELKVQDGLSPSWLPHTVRKCRGPCPPRRTGVKGATVWVFGGSSPCPLPQQGKDGLMTSGCGGSGLSQRLWRFVQCLFQRPLSPPVFIYSKKTKGNLQSPD